MWEDVEIDLQWDQRFLAVVNSLNFLLFETVFEIDNPSCVDETCVNMLDEFENILESNPLTDEVEIYPPNQCVLLDVGASKV